MRLLIAMLLTAILIVSTGCSSGDGAITSTEDIKIRCMSNGVSYYMSREAAGYSGWGYMAPVWEPDGSLRLCGPNALRNPPKPYIEHPPW